MVAYPDTPLDASDKPAASPAAVPTPATEPTPVSPAPAAPPTPTPVPAVAIPAAPPQVEPTAPVKISLPPVTHLDVQTSAPPTQAPVVEKAPDVLIAAPIPPMPESVPAPVPKPVPPPPALQPAPPAPAPIPLSRNVVPPVSSMPKALAAHEAHTSGTGPIIGVIIIVLLLVLGGLYFWGAQLNRTTPILPLIPGDAVPTQ